MHLLEVSSKIWMFARIYTLNCDFQGYTGPISELLPLIEKWFKKVGLKTVADDGKDDDNDDVTCSSKGRHASAAFVLVVLPNGEAARHGLA